MKRPTGSVYLIHFDARFHHAGHYIGYTNEKFPRKRLARHRSGAGAKLLRAIQAAGIGWRVVRVWMKASRGDERKLKGRGGAARLCPVCRYSGRKQAQYNPQAG